MNWDWSGWSHFVKMENLQNGSLLIESQLNLPSFDMLS